MAVTIENAVLKITNIDWNGDGSSETIEYHFEKDVLLKSVRDSQSVDTTVTEAAQPTQNAVMAFGGQTREVGFDWRMYNDGTFRDKTRGTMAQAGLADAQIAPGPISSVDTTNDTVTVPGDQTARVSSGDTVAVDTKKQATGNDGVYTVDSISYDSTNDETTIAVSGDLTDSTAIGAISHSVVTVYEQWRFFRKYIDNSNIRVQGRLYGLDYSDPDGDGVKEGTPVRLNNFRFRKQSEDPLRGNANLKADVGFSV